MAPAAWFAVLAAAYGAAGVVLGAFGAHGLESRLGAESLSVWRTAVLYQLVHALALLAVGLWGRATRAGGAPVPGALAIAGWSFAVGVLLFSGSLYLLALGGPGWLGPVTPVGGLAFVAGWLALAWAAWQAPSR